VLTSGVKGHQHSRPKSMLARKLDYGKTIDPVQIGWREND